VLFWKASGIDGDDHLIAKAVYRLSSIGAAQRIALSGLSSVVQGHSSSFSPHLCPGEAISGYSHRSLCAFYSNLYRAHLHYRCRGLAVAPRSPSLPNTTESIFTSKLPTWAAEAKRLCDPFGGDRRFFAAVLDLFVDQFSRAPCDIRQYTVPLAIPKSCFE
jgi:hypothetical protein